jgi:hypothetical protein
MNGKSNTRRKSFRDCSIFTANRSLSSIIDASDIEHLEANVLRILDAFAGEGIVADAFNQRLHQNGKKYSITVAEINPEHIENVSDEYRKLCLDIRSGQVDDTYDLIVMRYGLHDLSYDDKKNALRNLISTLDKNRKIVISDIMPDGKSREWLELHHQKKEILTRGPNKDVTLSSPEDYITLLQELGVQAGVKDSFYQEVFMREWVSTYGASEEALSALEDLTLQAPPEIKDRLMIFNHPKRGARIYFPVVTIAGVKNE